MTLTLNPTPETNQPLHLKPINPYAWNQLTPTPETNEPPTLDLKLSTGAEFEAMWNALKADPDRLTLTQIFKPVPYQLNPNPKPTLYQLNPKTQTLNSIPLPPGP